MLDGEIAFESEHLEANSRTAEVILSMSKNVVSIRENPHDIDSGRALGQALEQRRQALTSFESLRVVLNILFGIDDGHRCSVTGFNALQQCTDLVFSPCSHRYFNCNVVGSHSQTIRRHPSGNQLRWDRYESEFVTTKRWAGTASTSLLRIDWLLPRLFSLPHNT